MSAPETADIGIYFGPKMPDGLLERRYGPLIAEIGKLTARVVVLRGPQTFSQEDRLFNEYTVLDPERGVERKEGSIGVTVLRDFSGAHDFAENPPALNHQEVWALTRDKATTLEAFPKLLPMSAIVQQGDPEAITELQKLEWPSQEVIVKPPRGRASKGVSRASVSKDDALKNAIAKAAEAGAVNDQRALVEAYIDTTRGIQGFPETIGVPSTGRILALDGVPTIWVARYNPESEGDPILHGDDREEYAFGDPEMLGDAELEIVRKVHEEAARRGNGHSYLGIDLLYAAPDVPILGEANSRPAIIEKADSEKWSAVLAEAAARQMIAFLEANSGVKEKHHV